MEKATVKRIIGLCRNSRGFPAVVTRVEVGLDRTYFPHGPPLWKIRENILSYLYKSKREEY
jgi:hypothetical protein